MSMVKSRRNKMAALSIRAKLRALNAKRGRRARSQCQVCAGTASHGHVLCDMCNSSAEHREHGCRDCFGCGGRLDDPYADCGRCGMTHGPGHKQCYDCGAVGAGVAFDTWLCAGCAEAERHHRQAQRRVARDVTR